MNRSRTFIVVALVTVMSLAGLGAFTAQTNAQDTGVQEHPLVGTWMVRNDRFADGDVPEQVSFHSDGTLIDVQGSDVALGVWQATGPNSANITFSLFVGDDTGAFAGGYTVRATVAVSADGNSFTGLYTLQLIAPDGTALGQAGPGTVNGTRVVAEAPGTPDMTLDELVQMMSGGQ